MFSNNAIEADRLILEESLARLESLCPVPVRVEMVEESELLAAQGSFGLVLTMAQSKEALALLEKKFPHALIWNSPASIRNCYRKAMSTLLSALPVSYVPFCTLRTDGEIPQNLDPKESYWLKRSDFHAINDEDVTLAENIKEAGEKLEKFRQRGIGEVILQRHIHGDIYKFYGVKNQFFRPIRVRSFLPESSAPDFTFLKNSATLAAEALGLTIYGGDAILDAHGKFHLIDLNDWPSFRICREDASKAIAASVVEYFSSIRGTTNTYTPPVSTHA